MATFMRILVLGGSWSSTAETRIPGSAPGGSGGTVPARALCEAGVQARQACVHHGETLSAVLGAHRFEPGGQGGLGSPVGSGSRQLALYDDAGQRPDHTGGVHHQQPPSAELHR
ncbi:hypothetical protein ACFVXQ_14980 [Kitasatospora sp. NPDC058263]